MPPKLSTVKMVSAPRQRKPLAWKPPPIPSQQHKEKLAACQENQSLIDDAVSEWYIYTLAKADDLGKRFNKKPRYFLNIFFQGGAKMVNHQEKTNAYNAFKSLKAADLNKEGNPKNVLALQEDYQEEYEGLTNKEKEELIEEFNANKQEGYKIRRPTARAHIQDVANVAHNMQLLMTCLTYRVGVEGFFCIVQNSPDYHMKPQWYFTSPALEEYMKIAVRKKWDTAEIGTKLEAFAVAGCDVVNLLRTSKQKADHLKREIRQKISEMLVDITGNPNAVMQYVNYEEAIVQRYGIELLGWTYEKFVNSSELSTAVEPLRKLLDAIKSGDCKFIKLTAEERRKRLETYRAKIAAGEIKACERKTQSDAGTKKRKEQATKGDSSNDGDDRDSEEGDDSDLNHHGHKGRLSTKRRQTAGGSVAIITESNSESD